MLLLLDVIFMNINNNEYHGTIIVIIIITLWSSSDIRIHAHYSLKIATLW